LINLLAENLSIDKDSIRDLELCLYDTQPSTIGGINNEFIFSPRLDNLMMSFCSLTALIKSCEDTSFQSNSDGTARMCVLFDNEEVGSTSAYGANSLFLESTMRRIQAGGDQTAFEEAIQKSILISADMAHAVHPNYSDKHESNHRPVFGSGLVIKWNANQRYATTVTTALVLKHLAHKHSIPIQEFVIRNDSSCGSTIGPLLSAKLGIRTLDVGAPQLAMHSIREMGGTADLKNSVDLFTAFYQEFDGLNQKLSFD